MNCEFCEKMILEGEAIHGNRFGTVDIRSELIFAGKGVSADD